MKLLRPASNPFSHTSAWMAERNAFSAPRRSGARVTEGMRRKRSTATQAIALE